MMNTLAIEKERRAAAKWVTHVARERKTERKTFSHLKSIPQETKLLERNVI